MVAATAVGTLFNFLLRKATLAGLEALLLTHIFQGLGHIVAEFSSSLGFHHTQIAPDALGVFVRAHDPLFLYHIVISERHL